MPRHKPVIAEVITYTAGVNESHYLDFNFREKGIIFSDKNYKSKKKLCKTAF